jgi:hypothetical protein
MWNLHNVWCNNHMFEFGLTCNKCNIIYLASSGNEKQAVLLVCYKLLYSYILIHIPWFHCSERKSVWCFYFLITFC